MFARLIFVIAVLASVTARAEIRFDDALGRTQVLKAPAQRVVSLAPHITEVVYAAGAGDQLVGAVSYSDYPAAALDVPRIGSYNSISLESLVALKPDLVLAWRSGNGEEVIRRIESLGITVHVSEPRTLEDVAVSLRKVGVLTGNTDQAEAAAKEFMQRLEQLHTAYSTQRPIRVYYQIWNEPLMTLNGDHLISDVVRLCGGTNVFSDALALVSRISVESVIGVDPDVIVASGMDQARPEWLDDWLQWTSMRAVANEQLYFVPPDILQRHTPRIIDGATQLCEKMALARAFYDDQSAAESARSE